MKKLALLLSFIFLVTGTANALTINDFDLNSFDFDVTDYHTGSTPSGLNGDAWASGSSNGIAWVVGPTNLWSGRTTTNGSFNFDALPILTDNLHVSNDFTVTFDQTIDHLLVALDNDNLVDSINFGLVPTEVSNLSVSGTQITLMNGGQGGLALFTNVNSFTVTHTDNNNLFDGFDFAFNAVVAPVPEPATMMLFGIGLLGLAGVSRRKK